MDLSTVIGNNMSENGTSIKELTFEDIQRQLLNLVTGIDNKIQNISDSSFQVPTVDADGNIISPNIFDEETNPSALGKGYYSTILGITSP